MGPHAKTALPIARNVLMQTKMVVNIVKKITI